MKKITTPYKLSYLFLAVVLFAAYPSPLRAQENKLAAINNSGPAKSPVLRELPKAAPAPDLIIVPSLQPAPTLLTAGSPAVVQTTIRNSGNMRAGFSLLGYYLSVDATLSSDDILLSEAITTAVSPDSQLIIDTNIVVPTNSAAGAYYLLGVADYLNLVRESSDRNNVWAQRLTVALPSVSSGQHSQLATSNASRQEASTGLLAEAWSVAPNPVAHATPLRVQLSPPGAPTEVTLALYTSQGQQVAAQRLALTPGQPGQAEFSTEGLTAGMYVVCLSGPGLHTVRRVVVE
jgi:hypothetical protein